MFKFLIRSWLIPLFFGRAITRKHERTNTTREKVFDLGPMHMTADGTRTLS